MPGARRSRPALEGGLALALAMNRDPRLEEAILFVLGGYGGRLGTLDMRRESAHQKYNREAGGHKRQTKGVVGAAAAGQPRKLVCCVMKLQEEFEFRAARTVIWASPT